MTKKFNYYDFIMSRHELYNRYYNDWKLAVRSYWGGVEYRNGFYLKAYDIDYSTPSDTVATYDVEIDGVQTKMYSGTATRVNTPQELNTPGQFNDNFYMEKVDNVPVLPYVRLYTSEYNAILFKTPPVRQLPDTPDINTFLQNCDGESNSVNEFMSQVDVYTTVYGVVWVSCIKPAGSNLPRWRWHSPTDVTNWEYTYNINGDQELSKIVIRVATEPDLEIFQYFTTETIETVFVPTDEDTEITVPEGAEFIEAEEDGEKGFYRIVQPNELGHLRFIRPVYQSNKIYNGVGHTPIFDIAQLQRSNYAYYGEIYSAVSYSSHPVTIIDEVTLEQNGYNVGAEPGSTLRVQAALAGTPNHVFEFVAPPLNSITELRALVDQNIDKMNEVAMVNSAEMMRRSNSAAQIEQYDAKLEAFIRKKAVGLENLEAQSLWPSYFEWMEQPVPEDFYVSYNRLYNKKGVEQEIEELNKLIDSYQQYIGAFGENIVSEDEYSTQQQAEARAAELGGSGYHQHEQDGVVYYMPFATHAEYELRLRMAGLSDNDLALDIRETIERRMYQLLESSYSENSL